MRLSKIIGIRRAYVLLILVSVSSCGVFHRSPDVATSPATKAGFRNRTQGQFMLSDSSPVYEHPDKASAVITYIPRQTHGSVTTVSGDWLPVRLPDGKVGFIPTDSAKQPNPGRFV
jgi:hypothetical protein